MKEGSAIRHAEAKARIEALAGQSGYALRRRNVSPYGWSVIDAGGRARFSGEFPDIEEWLTRQAEAFAWQPLPRLEEPS